MGARSRCHSTSLACLLCLVALQAAGILCVAHAHGHAGCGHTLVAGEAKRWSELHRQHRQLLDQQAEAGIVLQEQPVPAAAAAPEDVDSFADSSSSFASSNTSARPVPRMLAASSGTVPIRVWVEYQGISSLSEDGKQRLYDTVNIALGVLQKFFKVRKPTPGRLLVKPFCRMWSSVYYCNLHQPDFLTSSSDNTCGAATINSSHVAPYEQCAGGGFSCQKFPGGTGEFTDYYLYITAHQDEHCASGAVAWALPCLYDTNTNRPLLGSANICPQALMRADPEAGVAVLVHELTHALGFTDDMFDKFIDANGQPIPKNQVVQRYVDPYERTTAMVITPTVVKEVRAQFGCETLPGAALENEGGQGSANAHWEYRWFQGELMVATNLFAVYGKPATMSRITLAFMQDTGWYDVDMDAAGFLNWGNNAGCAFVEKTCNDWIAANPSQQFFCTREQYGDTVNTMCTFDGLARARCEDAQFADGCGMKVALGTSPNCLSKQYQASAGDKFGWQNGLSSRCVPVTWLFNTYAYQFPDSTFKDGWRDSMCYSSSCSAEGVLQLDILGNKVSCPSGQMVDLAKVLPNQFQKGMVGPCPDNAAICNTLSCNESCTVGGTCVQGKCFCNLQYTGPECAKKLTPSGNYTTYQPVADDGTSAFSNYDSGYLMMSSRLASSQNALYAALDKYKAAVAQLAGVTTTRVAVLSFLSDTPATSLVGRRLAAATPLPPSLDAATTTSRSSSSRSLQQAAAGAVVGTAWSWELLPFAPEEFSSGSPIGGGDVVSSSDSSSRGLLSAAASAAGRLLLQSGSGHLEVYSRIATLGQADADAIVSRINNATRQAEFDKALTDAGLKLVPGSVAVRKAGQGGPGGTGWGLPGLNWNDPNQRRIIIIVAASVGAALVVMLLIWWATCCVRRRRRGAAQAGLQQQFISSGGRTPGSATPGSSQGSSSSGLRPLFGAAAAPPSSAAGRPAVASNGRPLYNPFAAPPAAASTYGPSAYGLPVGRGSAGPQPPAPSAAAAGYTVAGRTFATAKEADDYALALALSQSLQQQNLAQQQPTGGGAGGFFSRYLPHSSSNSSARPSQRQQDQQQLSGYPAIGFGHGFGAQTPYR